jgi:hypothetical protein
LRALNPVNKNAERISDLKSKISTLNWVDLTIPVKLKDIDMFEKLNPNYAVNVMGFDGTCVYPLRKSEVNTVHQLNLLLHEEHYGLISNFGRLFNSQIAKHHGARFYCYRYLNSFACKSALENHEECCKNHYMARIGISKDPVKFKNSYRAMRVPFTIYADYETFNVKINSCQPKLDQGYTQKIMKQVPSSFCFYLVSVTGERLELFTYTAQGDEDIGAMFNLALIEYTHKIYNKHEK